METTIIIEENNNVSDCTDSKKNQENEKKRSLSKSTIGNMHKFNQQLPEKPTKSTLARITSELTARENFKDLKILNQIEGLSNCCPVGGEHGCCLKHFVDKNGAINYENAVNYVRNCRVVSKEGSSNEIRDQVIINIFKSCILDDMIRGEERIFKMDYQIPSPQNLLGRDNKVKCCRNAVLIVYGLTDYEWKLTSSLMKTAENGNLQTLHDSVPETNSRQSIQQYAEESTALQHLPEHSDAPSTVSTSIG